MSVPLGIIVERQAKSTGWTFLLRRSDDNARLVQGFASGLHQFEGARGVAVQADGIEFDQQVFAFYGAYAPGLTGTQDPRRDGGRIKRAHSPRKYNGAAQIVLTVGVKLAHHRLPKLFGNAPDDRV